MLSTRDAVVLRKEDLPGDGGYVAILQQPDGRVLVKRYVTRGKVFNVVDRYEIARVDGTIDTTRLTAEIAHVIVDRLLAGQPWSDCFVLGAVRAPALPWERSPAEHRYTSTGVKFWRHRSAMESYRAGTGRTVISTHISPEGACNLRCSFCSVTYRDTHSRIELPRVKRYVTDLQSRGLKAVILTGGGEPTLYPQFNELVQWIKAQGLSVALITNGTTRDRVAPETWRAFSWVRVSINIFDGWKERILVPRDRMAPDCVVGASFVYTVEHEAASEEVPLERVELFRQVGEVAARSGAEYIRVLPNCLLEQAQLVREHQALKRDLETLGDQRFFQQYKVHQAPAESLCHQAYFRPYLSEEPFVGPRGEGDGQPGTVYPCDSVVLNDSAARFAAQWQICKPEDVLAFMDGDIAQNFDPRKACSGCVFTGNVEQLGAWERDGVEHFDEYPDPLVHEEFV